MSTFWKCAGKIFFIRESKTPIRASNKAERGSRFIFASLHEIGTGRTKKCFIDRNNQPHSLSLHDFGLSAQIITTNSAHLNGNLPNAQYYLVQYKPHSWTIFLLRSFFFVMYTSALDPSLYLPLVYSLTERIHLPPKLNPIGHFWNMYKQSDEKGRGKSSLLQGVPSKHMRWQKAKGMSCLLRGEGSYIIQT